MNVKTSFLKHGMSLQNPHLKVLVKLGDGAPLLGDVEDVNDHFSLCLSKRVNVA